MSMSDTDREALAALLYPDAEPDIEKIHARYPPRDLPHGALVTRFGPSPTGFIHIGGVMTALLNKKLSEQSGGVFILRIEDTDQAREVKGGVDMFISALNALGVGPKEGPRVGGNYGPYYQSERLPIYRAFARDLVRRGRAYPCFLTEDELTAIRAEQEAQKVNPGVRGKWAKSRTLTLEDIRKNLDEKKSWVLRLWSTATIEERIVFKDRIRGALELPANPLDTVLIKADGFPTYHFAHPIDDTLMRINLIIRGDEWISTTPVHVMIFDAMGVECPQIAHIAPVEKLDGTSRRKLSKRLDPEASMGFYEKAGYPSQSIIEYLLNMLDSAFEPWRTENPLKPYADFELSVDRLGRSGSLCDIDKLNSVSREVIATIGDSDLFNAVIAWAKRYDERLLKAVEADLDLAEKAINIGRGSDKPRKDYAKWEDVGLKRGYFFSDYFDELTPQCYQNLPSLPAEEAAHVVEYFLKDLDDAFQSPSDEWIGRAKTYALDRGYVKNPKKLKNNPDAKGVFSDFMKVARVAVAGSTESPDLHESMVILGQNVVRERLERLLSYLRS
ncbi:MAG: glutamate--tRNA ligase family protein [Myxococcota bacterium]